MKWSVIDRWPVHSGLVQACYGTDSLRVWCRHIMVQICYGSDAGILWYRYVTDLMQACYGTDMLWVWYNGIVICKYTVLY